MSNTSSIVPLQGRLSVVLALVVFCLTMPSSAARAATYYVDGDNPNAHDINPGTELSPWKTISRATGLLQPGDTLLVKAGTYRETVILTRSGTSTTALTRSGLVTTTSSITIAAYPGHEGKVVINAAEPLTNWRKCTGPQDCAGNPNWSHIYWADVASLVAAHPDKDFAVRQVFQKGERLPRSRFPDTRWSYPTSIVNPKTAFSDSTLSIPAGYFNGAVCHIKTAQWRIDQIPIASSSGSTIVLATSPNPWYDISTRFGYYITSVVGEINAAGEWAYDPAHQRLYLWPKGERPEEVEFTYREYCLRTYDRVSFNVVRGFTMRNAYQYGVFLYLANDMTIENNTIEYAFAFGIHLQATGGPCNNNQIIDNTIRHSAYRGINVGAGASHCNVEGNTVYATGVEHFGGDLMNGPSEGVYIEGPDARVYHNRIDRTGNVGLYLHGEARSREVSYNHVSNSGLALSDTAGLYTDGFHDGPEQDRIHHNIIEDSFGCRTMDRLRDRGTPVTVEAYAGDASGIYVDEEGNNRIIEDNTVIGSHFAGIFFHQATANVVRNNTLYGNRVSQIYLVGRNLPRRTLVDNILLDNILFATDIGQTSLYLTAYYMDVRLGQSDRNYFYHPYKRTQIHVDHLTSSSQWSHNDFTLDGWRTFSGYDGSSREFSSLTQLDGVVLKDPKLSKIVYNASLDAITVDLGPDKYCDVQGNKIQGAVTLEPFTSKVLIPADFIVPALPLP